MAVLGGRTGREVVLMSTLITRPPIAILAVTTLQALGWHPPRRHPDTNAEEAWTAYEQAMNREET